MTSEQRNATTSTTTQRQRALALCGGALLLASSGCVAEMDTEPSFAKGGKDDCAQALRKSVPPQITSLEVLSSRKIHVASIAGSIQSRGSTNPIRVRKYLIADSAGNVADAPHNIYLGGDVPAAMIQGLLPDTAYTITAVGTECVSSEPVAFRTRADEPDTTPPAIATVERRTFWIALGYASGIYVEATDDTAIRTVAFSIDGEPFRTYSAGDFPELRKFNWHPDDVGEYYSALVTEDLRGTRFVEVLVTDVHGNQQTASATLRL